MFMHRKWKGCLQTQSCGTSSLLANRDRHTGYSVSISLMWASFWYLSSEITLFLFWVLGSVSKLCQPWLLMFFFECDDLDLEKEATTVDLFVLSTSAFQSS
ncbi:hypothetical protein EV2_015650 [Malus domestica]